MNQAEAAARIESEFRRQVRRSRNPRNSYLRVLSGRSGVDLGIAEGTTGNVDASMLQPVHLAGVGKLFTATIVSILNERGELSFSDPVSRYLDADLMEELVRDPSIRMTPREAVEWGKRHLTPKSRPGEKHHYTDTNYYLLGLVVESITKKPFHDALHRLIFDPLGMERAYMHGYPQPKVESKLPPAGLFINVSTTHRCPALPRSTTQAAVCALRSTTT